MTTSGSAPTTRAPRRAGEGGLGRVRRDHHHLHVRVQGTQDGGRRRAERPGSVDERPAARRGRVPGHRVQRDRERVGEDGDLVGDVRRDREQHRVMGGEVVGEPSRSVLAGAGVDPGGQRTVGEMPAHAQVTGAAGWARRIDPSWSAGQPGIEQDTLADLEALRARPDLGDLPDHLVAHDHRKREVRGQCTVVVGVREVTEDLFRLGTADAGQPGPGHDPVVPGRRGHLAVHQAHRHPGQSGEQPVGGVGRLPLLGADSPQQRLHRRPSSLRRRAGVGPAALRVAILPGCRG